MNITRGVVSGFACLTVGATLSAQGPPETAAATVRRVEETIARIATEAPDSIWPGFRPDTIPRLYVVSGHGVLLTGWSGQLPSGFAPAAGGFAWSSDADRSAASTSVELGGRRAAQIVVGDTAVATNLLALAFHESFHVLQRSLARPGGRFGSGENTFLLTRYPVFSETNEAAFALEGLVLQSALDEGSDTDARELAQQFLAVRHARQRELGPGLREFETMAELNEGLAEYASVRGLQLAATDPMWREEADSQVDEMIARLESLTDNSRLSVRTRYYVTGSAIALLIDRLAGFGWQSRLVEENLELQDILGYESGFYEHELALLTATRAANRWDRLLDDAQVSVGALRAERQSRVDSVLAAPGLEIVISTGGSIGLCGMDPQNMLQVEPGVFLHTRWVRPCVGSAFQGEFNTPVVHDQNAGTLAAVLGAPDEIEIRIGDQHIDLEDGIHIEGAENVRITATTATLNLAQADLVLRDRVLEIVLHR